MKIPSENPFSPTSVTYAIVQLWVLVQIPDCNNVDDLPVGVADELLGAY